MNAPRFRYRKCEPIPGDTGKRFVCPENGYYNMTAAEMERADAEEAASRAKDRREPATGEPDGEADAPKTDCAPNTTRGSPPEAQPTPSQPTKEQTP
jgi:hypothetical protein